MRTQFLLPAQSFSILKALPLDEKDSWHESMLDILNDVIAVNPITTNGTIKYPTNNPINGVNPIAFPIIPFLFINCPLL